MVDFFEIILVIYGWFMSFLYIQEFIKRRDIETKYRQASTQISRLNRDIDQLNAQRISEITEYINTLNEVVMSPLKPE